MKQLISAETLRAAHAAGQSCIAVNLRDCIVTPEARVVAERLGVAIVEDLPDGAAAPQPVPVAASASPAAEPSAEPAADDALAEIRAAVLARLPAGSVPEALVEQLVRKAAAEHAGKPAGPAVKCVRAADVRMGAFDGAGPGMQVGIADVITAEDGSSMAAGFMQWENAFFPWTLNYDEVDMVLEGELHIRRDGRTTIGKAGDVIFIPKGSSIEFGTPTSVRFLYVAYPANWQEC